MENEIEAKDVAEQQASSHRERQLVQLFGDIIAGLNFARIAEYSGRSAEDLEASARALLADFLQRFPNIIESCSGGWHVGRRDQGFGTYRVEMFYSRDVSSGLFFTPGKIKEAHELGLIDDDGEPVDPPPVCYVCHHPLNEKVSNPKERK